MSRDQGSKADRHSVIWVIRQRETRIGAADVGPVLAQGCPVKRCSSPNQPRSVACRPSPSRCSRRARARACRVAHLGCARGPSLSPLAQGCLGNRRRLRRHDPVQRERIPVVGLGPWAFSPRASSVGTHVFGAEIVASSRRGCPGRARARGSCKQNLG